MSRLIKRERGIAIDNVDADTGPDSGAAKMGEIRYGSETVLPVYLVTETKNLNTVQSGYVSYGNEASLSHFYLEARKAVSNELRV